MLTHQIIGHASNDTIVREIMDRIADALAVSKLNVRMADYQESVKVDGANGGDRMLTGNRTVVIEFGSGDKDVEIGYSPSDCCGG